MVNGCFNPGNHSHHRGGLQCDGHRFRGLYGSDTISIDNASLFVSLGNDTSICDLTYTLEPAFDIDFFNDSLIITYDATQGVTSLGGAGIVYMHSGLETAPFAGWEYVVGNWGMNDGIGQMVNIGPDLWQITIDPYSYYGVPPGTPLNGIFCVFRNETGMLTGRDDLDDDIYIDLTVDPPVSAFGGISATWKRDGIGSLLWSDGSDGNSLTVDTSGMYWLEVTDTAGCMASDTIEVTFLTVPEPDLGPDTSLCDTPFTVTISAGSGFSSYAWSDGSTGMSTIASAFGTYSVTVTNAAGCAGSDEMSVVAGITPGAINLGNDTAICGFGSILLSSNISFSPEGDTLVITYDATEGVTELVGASKVYFHSGAEITPGVGWEYPIGNWGIDDGIGQMTNVGTDLWEIRIHPQTYYGYTGISTLNKIYMVFRDQDTLSGRDWDGNDIVLEMTFDPPVDTFSGVWAMWDKSPYTSILWSDGSTDPTLPVSTAGTYWAMVMDSNGCSVSDSIDVSIAPLPLVDLGPDTATCDGGTILLDAGAGFSAYAWSDGVATQTNTVTTGGTYTVTVTDDLGCEGGDVINVILNDSPTADFAVGGSTLTATFTDASLDAVDYQWDFTSDGTIDDTTPGTTSFTYPGAGVFTATLIVSNECGSDTISKVVVVPILAIDNPDFELIHHLWPNPAQDVLHLEMASHSDQPIQLYLVNLMGQVLISSQIRPISGEATEVYDLSRLSTGPYILRAIQNGKSWEEMILKQ